LINLQNWTFCESRAATQAFEKAMPRGAFRWHVERATKMSNSDCLHSFEAAVTGENAMKNHLANCATWLGGEFYLAAKKDIDEAWKLGHAAAHALECEE
jgi:hypothetical protein